MLIRAVRMEDASDIRKLRAMDGVRENILGLASERLEVTEAYLRNLTNDDHVLVAEQDGQVIGMAGLHVPGRPRLRHSGDVGIMVHVDRQGQGVGTALLTALLDLADNWLMLKRVELSVFVDNPRAVELYKKLGFVIEGTKKYAAIRHGVYADEYLMARYRI